jgi:4-methyl-5(b-hydroxyethyl)-thiazole monophosphate biosynthesis
MRIVTSLLISKLLLLNKNIQSSYMSTSSSLQALVPIANGSEEIEAVTIIDTLVRAGIHVTSASVEKHLQVECSRGVKIVANKLIDECEDHRWDVVVCPGGMPGAKRLFESSSLTNILTRQRSEGRLIAAICASPAVVLAGHHLLGHHAATCYPAHSFVGAISNYTDAPVVVDHQFITSQGPGTSLDFSLKIVKHLLGADRASEVASGMLYKGEL